MNCQQALGVILDCVDYTNHAWWVNEMVRAVLPANIIAQARTALKDCGTQPTPTNTVRDAIIAEAVEAWREWDAMPDKMLSDRLVNGMHALAELYPQ